MTRVQILVMLVLGVALGISAIVLTEANAREITSAQAQEARLPSRALSRAAPVAPPEHTRTYESRSAAMTLQTGADGVTPQPDYDCSHAGGQVQECWCDDPLDCKDMVLNGPCAEDDVWWTSGETTLGCTIQDND